MSDLISREALKDTMDYIEQTSISYEEMYDRLKKAIASAPTVYPICEDKACKYRAKEADNER